MTYQEKSRSLSIKALENLIDSCSITEMVPFRANAGEQADNPKQALISAMLDANLHSAHAVSSLSEANFMDNYARKLPVSENDAKKIHQNAVAINHKMLNLFVSLSTTVNSQYQNVLNNVGADMETFFKKTPNYEGIFGNQDFCDCDECNSIFGPGAYFMDLMRIVDKYITQRFWPGDSSANERAFPNRRPDLFTLEVTCSHTNTEIPYIKIVNANLENILKKIYTGKDIYEQMSAGLYPFQLPFHLPMEKIRKWLSLNQTSLRDIYEGWKRTPKEVAIEQLHMTPGIFNRITQKERYDAAALGQLYGREEKKLSDIYAALSSVDTFLQSTGLSRNELNALLTQDLTIEEIEKGLAHSFYINQGCANNGYLNISSDSKLNVDTQNNGLEYVARFIRLCRYFSWTYPQLDWLLKMMNKGAAVNAINENTVIELTKLLSVMETYRLGYQDAAAMLGPLKDYGQDSPFHAIFPTSEFENLPIAWEPEKDISFTNHLAECLQTDISGLQQITALFLTPGTNGKILLDTDSLSSLYRHVRMAKILAQPIRSYIVWLTLCSENPKKDFAVLNIDQMVQIMALQKFNTLGPYQIDYFVNGTNSAVAKDMFTDEALRQFLVTVRAKNTFQGGVEEEEKIKEFVLTELSVFLNTDKQILESVLGFVPELPEKIAAQPLKEEETDFAAIKKLLSILSRWLMLLNQDISPMLAAKITEKPAYFQITDIKNISLDHLLTIQMANQHLVEWGEIYFQIIDHHTQKDKLYEIIGKEQADVDSILSVLQTGKESGYNVQQFDGLLRCLRILDALKVNAAFMEQLLRIESKPYADIEAVAKRVYHDSSKFDSIEAAKRDALVSITLVEKRKQYADINNADQLYKYLLMDVNMDETIYISKIKEGINALQLYLNRCRMGLEPGIGKLDDIPQSWWTWLMNYNLWEANRKIFVYPENYLLPSVRNSKSALFKDMESALQQSQISDGYVEEQYIKYLDELAELVKLKPCGAYASDINGQSVLYLFGRTLNQPYSYYYCKRVEQQAWGEWQKIEINIDQEFITPVFVFNKLHLIWSEIKKISNPVITSTDTTSIHSEEHVLYKMDVKYTFLNLQGKWIQPQSLISGLPIFYKDEPFTNDKNPLEHAFDMENSAWRKINAFRLTNRNFQDEQNNQYYINKPENYERLLIMAGSFMHNSGGGAPVISQYSENDEKNNYIDKYNTLIRSLNIANQYTYVGHLITGFTKAFNEDMEEDYMVTPKEVTVLDEYNFDSQYIAKPLSDNIKNIVGVEYSYNALRNSISDTQGILSKEISYDEEKKYYRIKITKDSLKSYTLPETIATDLLSYLSNKQIITTEGYLKDPQEILNMNLYDWVKNQYNEDKEKLNMVPNKFTDITESLRHSMGSVRLFSTAEKAKIIPVVNQPGWFLYDCNDETFLLYPREEDLQYSKLDSGLVISFPLITYTSLSSLQGKMGDFDNVLTDLKDNKIIGRNWRLYYENCTPERLKEAFEVNEYGKKNIDKIYSLLHDRFIATDDMFLSRSVKLDISLQYYKTLAGSQNPEPFIRVNREAYLAKDPKEVLSGYSVQLTPEQVSGIFETFVSAPAAIAVKYQNRYPQTKLLQDCQYKVVRLTNAGVKSLKNKIYLGGVKQFLTLKSQEIPVVPVMPFNRLLPNEKNVIPPSALDGAQVDFEGLYSEYNWELFYHIPILIAQGLKSGQQNELAKTWFEYIFNPNEREQFLTSESFYALSGGVVGQAESAKIFALLTQKGVIANGRVLCFENLAESTKLECEKLLTGNITLKMTVMANILHNYSLASENNFYWNFRPFRNHTLQKLIDSLKEGSPALKAYNDFPFDPHAIARLRIGAYEKYTVMEYILNLVDWGDRMFSQYTWESITSATMLYVLAAELLGPRPEKLAVHKKETAPTFEQIKQAYPEGVPQFLLELENLCSLDSQKITEPLNENNAHEDVKMFLGIPQNKQLLAIWDLVGDRLYKIRHSMDINGVLRKLKLFEPPLDPMQLAKAASYSNNVSPSQGAAGTIINYYRFSVLIEQAKSLTNQLISLGGSILGALEKYDAEKLAMISNTQEQTILGMTTSIKEGQIKEIESSMASLDASLESAALRNAYYKKQADEFMSPEEVTSFETLTLSSIFGLVASEMKFAAGISRLLPQVGSPFAMKYGGLEVGSSLDTIGSAFEITAATLSAVSNCVSIMANYKRRYDEWRLQESQSALEMRNIKSQIASVKERKQNAEQELQIHKKTMEHRMEIAAHYKSKFTNSQLYQWMTGKLRGTMLQTYQLALELGMKAQAAYQHEKGSNKEFINFQYWSSEKSGLLSGESLMLALNQMEASYLSDNERVFEIEKNVSLALECPEAFLKLRSTGSCDFVLTEKMFAQDFPGGYNRKIKSVSISIPAILGPYQTLKAILTQKGSVILGKPGDTDSIQYMLDYPHNTQQEIPDGIGIDYRMGQRIALSKGIDDYGMFVIDFNDVRYLPFEGTGAVSQWALSMPKENNPLDFNSLSDVIVNIKYTAKESAAHGEEVRKLWGNTRESGLYFNLCQNFPSHWYEFMHDATKDFQSIVFPVIREPFHQTGTTSVSGLLIRLQANESLQGDYQDIFKAEIPSADELSLSLANDVGYKEIPPIPFKKAAGNWKIKVDIGKIKTYPQLKFLLKNDRLSPEAFKNLEVIVVFENTMVKGVVC